MRQIQLVVGKRIDSIFYDRYNRKWAWSLLNGNQHKHLIRQIQQIWLCIPECTSLFLTWQRRSAVIAAEATDTTTWKPKINSCCVRRIRRVMFVPQGASFIRQARQMRQIQLYGNPRYTAVVWATSSCFCAAGGWFHTTDAIDTTIWKPGFIELKKHGRQRRRQLQRTIALIIQYKSCTLECTELTTRWLSSSVILENLRYEEGKGNGEEQLL